MQEGDFSQRLKQFMKAKGLSQKALASAAGVSQSAVSRILRNASQRQGRANSQLCIYMQQQPGYEAFEGEGKEKVLRAFESIWDKTEKHATAIARIIKAAEGLRPATDGTGEESNA